MGGSSSQVVGYKYYSCAVVAIGLPIEDFLGINVDKRGWTWGSHAPMSFNDNGVNYKYGVNVSINEPYMFGKDEGGMVGTIRAYFGTQQQLPDPDYSKFLVSKGLPPVAYQGSLSYLVFAATGASMEKPNDIQQWVNELKNGSVGRNSFYWGNSGLVKEMQLMVKRVNIKNDSSPQWYPLKAEIVAPAKYGTPEYAFDGLTWEMTNPQNTVNRTATVNIIGDTTATHEVDIYIDALVELRQVNGATPVGFTGHVVKGGTYGANAGFNEYTLSVSNPPQTYRLNVGTSSADLTSYSDKITIQVKHGATVTAYATSVDGFMISDYQYVKFKASKKGNPTEINPAHAIRELFTDDTAIGLPETSINNENFRAVADLFYNEGLGISYCFVNEDCNELIEKICYHVEAGVRENRQTGLIEIIPFRDNWFDLNTVPTFSGKDILDFTAEGINKQEATNVINVKHMDRDRNQTVSFPLKNIGAIQTIGLEIPADVSFPYYYINEPALKVANWKLKQLTTPSWRGTLVTASSKALLVNRYDVVKLVLPWYKSTLTLTVRVMSVKIGTGSNSNQTEFDWVELIPYSTASYLTPSITPPIEKSTSPKPNKNILKELTYYEAVKLLGQRSVDEQIQKNPDLSYVSVFASSDQLESSFAILYTNSGTGYEQGDTTYYTPYFTLKEAVTLAQTEFEISTALYAEDLVSGSLAWLNNEIIIVQAYNSETGTLTVKRGASPTVPKSHPANSEIFVHGVQPCTDKTEYVEGAIVNSKVLTCTASGVESLNTSSEKTIQLVALASRPYVPANVKINNTYYPEEVTGELLLSWVHRNRYEQTSEQQLSFFDNTVSPEVGVEYVIELYNTDNVLITTTNVGTATSAVLDYSSVTTTTCKIKLYSILNGLTSFQAYEHEVKVSFNPPYNIQGTWNDTTQSLDLTWEFDE